MRAGFHQRRRKGTSGVQKEDGDWGRRHCLTYRAGQQVEQREFGDQVADGGFQEPSNWETAGSKYKEESTTGNGHIKYNVLP